MHYKLSGEDIRGYVTLPLAMVTIYLLLPLVAPLVLILIGVVGAGGMRSGTIGRIVSQVEENVKKLTDVKKKGEVKERVK